MSQKQQIREIADEIGKMSNSADDAIVILGGIAHFLTLRYGPRTAAETFYSFADEIACSSPREWRL